MLLVSRRNETLLTVAAEAGAPLFQYRNKTASMKEAYGEALALRQAAAKAGVLFIVNDQYVFLQDILPFCC